MFTRPTAAVPTAIFTAFAALTLAPPEIAMIVAVPFGVARLERDDHPSVGVGRRVGRLNGPQGRRKGDLRAVVGRRPRRLDHLGDQLRLCR